MNSGASNSSYDNLAEEMAQLAAARLRVRGQLDRTVLKPSRWMNSHPLSRGHHLPAGFDFSPS